MINIVTIKIYYTLGLHLLERIFGMAIKLYFIIIFGKLF